MQLSKIKSNQTNYLMFLQNSNFKDFKIKEDLIMLINFYNNNGFKNVNISQQIEYFKDLMELDKKIDK